MIIFYFYLYLLFISIFFFFFFFFFNDTATTEIYTLSLHDALPIRDSLRKDALFPGWTATRFNAFVVGWNTKLVPAGQEPKSFEDLADPKWKGKLAMELSDFDWYMALHTYLTTKKGMSDAQADDLFKRLVANAKVVKGHTVMGELLSAG